VGELVAVAAVGRELLPPHAEPVHHARPGPRPDHGPALDLATVVEDAHLLALHDAARRGIAGIDLEHRLAVDAAQAGDVDEGGS
jgi:hypothetical protein